VTSVVVALIAATATIIAAVLAYLGQREARRGRRAAEATVLQVDGTNGHTLHETIERIRTDNEKTHAVLLSHIAQLQDKLAMQAAELASFRAALTAHMDDEMGDEGSYATVLHAVNDLREDMIGVRSMVDQVWQFMKGYDGSELPDGQAVNDLVSTVESMDLQVLELHRRLVEIEQGVGNG